MKPTALLIALLMLLSAGFSFAAEEETVLSPERQQTLASIQKLTSYEDGLDLYTMEVFYEYDIDALTPVGPADDDTMVDVIFAQALPGVDVELQAPDFGCTAFTLKAGDGKVYMGRNYDFAYDTSAMLCYCRPENGYASVCFSALSNIDCNDPLSSPEKMAASLAAPLIPLDGMNEKGVSIAVLTLKSEPTAKNTGKPVLFTPVLLRLVLDRAASTEEAIELISQYDIHATSGRDYHFYITDASGNGVIVEWDCDQADRPMVVTPVRTATNYFIMHEDKFEPGQDKGDYGVGHARRDKAEAVFEAAGSASDMSTAWEACMAASSKPDPESIVSNTQWSVVYGNTDLNFEFTLHRHWEDRFAFELKK